ncbi:ABC transporter permease [Adhaeribacter radiodurans]|uniref:ABC transporter permease n=1 Tax=Adhaeribacter radiodurans TaxID=2745197 RepID=A0A7L7L4V6_9BACT|nr:ABC transporter permease [Adhaeribacter radiodurans]QMU27803.1 ABC transporter permease [Adhaeribacter radiodurans]
MLKNYFKIAWRNLLRNKAYSAINIAGLATGISACILIFFYVKDELTYEQHFDKYDRIFRVVTDINLQGQQDKFARSPAPLAAAMQKDYPEIQKVARLLPIGKQTVWLEDKAYNEEDLFFADSTFFDIFSYEFLVGNPQTALQNAQTVVVSDRLAEKYFGAIEDAVGQVLQFSNNAYVVTGVFKDDQHSHIKANLFLSERTLKYHAADSANYSWFAMNWFTYILLSEPDQASSFQQKLDRLYNQEVAPWSEKYNVSARLKFSLQPISVIHLTSDRTYDISPAGNKSYVYIFGLVAVFILLIACINYMNLATARSSKRAREVGLRKVVGAHRSQLVWQFVGESILITLMAILLAVASVEIMLPYFNALTGKNFTHASFTDASFIGTLALIVLFVGIIAGSYPAFFLSKFKPAEVLKSDKNPRSNSFFRKGLVVVQFTISLILISGTLIVYRQMQFLKNSGLGFHKEQLLVIEVPLGDSTLTNRLPEVKAKLLKQPQVEKVSTSIQIPGERTSRVLVQTKEKDRIVEKTMAAMFVDYDFLDLMGIKLVKGRNFSKNHSSDQKAAYLINEAAARELGWKNPLGKKLVMGDYDSSMVVGIVKDFHYTSLHHKIEPLIIALAPTPPAYLLVRLKPEHLPRTIRNVEAIWKTFDPKHPMEYYFLDDNFAKQYRSEEKMLTVFGYFAGLTILIACLGLFGLTSFTAEQRTKEIGIRKVLGSSVTDIIILLSKDFALLVLIAIILACPVAWYGMHYWLQDFAYQLPIQWWVFVVAGVAALVIAMLTVSFQAAKAAWLNPVKALRSE